MTSTSTTIPKTTTSEEIISPTTTWTRETTPATSPATTRETSEKKSAPQIAALDPGIIPLAVSGMIHGGSIAIGVYAIKRKVR
ncbi:MAG: hypothetical protein ACFFB5_12610 [Promethearchaeota archaeon]